MAVGDVVRVKLSGGLGLVLPDTLAHLTGTDWGVVQASGATEDVLPGSGGPVVTGIPSANLQVSLAPAVATLDLTGTIVRRLVVAGGAFVDESDEYDAKVVSALNIDGAEKVFARTLSNGAYWERPPGNVRVLPDR